MNRKLLNGFLVAVVAVGGVVTFTSCKDEDFRNNVLVGQVGLQDQIDAIRTLSDQDFKNALQAWLDEQEISKIWEDIKNYNPAEGLPEYLKPYIQGLYDILYNEIFPEETWFQNLQAAVAKVDNLAIRPSSVEVSHVYNTVFGTVNTPVGIKTSILASYQYKSSNSDYNFPTGAAESDFAYGYNQEAFNAIKSLAPEAFALKEGFADPVEFGNMGGAVVTINPSDVDFSSDDYTYNFVNSLGEVVLTSEGENPGLKVLPYESDKALAFGATRAATEGVYELDVNATKDNAAALTVDFDKEGVKDAFKSFMDKKDLSNIAGLGRTLLDAINNKVPAYALQISWTENQPVVDPTTGEYVLENVDGEWVAKTEEKEVSYQTGFDYAAVVAQPLSYNSGKALAGYLPSDKKLPTVGKLTDYLDKIGNKITIDITNADLVSSVDIYIEVQEVTDNTSEYAGYLMVIFHKGSDVTGDVIGVTYYDNHNGLNLTPQQLQDLAQALVGGYNDIVVNADIVDNINKAIESINDAIGSVETTVGDFQDYINKIKNSSKLKYAQKLVDLYNRVAGQVNNMLADPARYFQILALFDANDGGVHRMATTPADAYQVNVSGGKNSFMMYLTSYNGEIIVPAYKKYVAITKVGETAATAAVNTGDLNKVLPGYTQAVAVEVPSTAKNGDMLQITYVAVDYHGVCSMQNYYVRVVK